MSNQVVKIDLPSLELIRLEEDQDYGTFGVLKIQKQVFCVTLEPPDLLNLVNQSSIPAQQYYCQRISSPTFGLTFQLINVPGRTSILFHPGNSVENTEGCILLAEYFGKLRGARAILNSGETFKKFLRLLSSHEMLHLTIKEAF